MEQRELIMCQKFLGMVGKMRKHQKEYFRLKTDFDKKEAIRYEAMVDEYIRLLMKAGLTPVFDDKTQTNLF